MVEEKISRRNYAKAAAAGVVGVVIGAAGGYYGAPKAPSETITKTETATVTEGAPQPPPTTVAPPSEPVELNWIEWSGYPEIVVNDTITGFNKQYPDIKINPILLKWPDLLPKDTVVLNAKDPSVDLIYLDGIWVPKFVEEGWVLDITDRITPAMKDDLFESALYEMTYKGRIWGTYPGVSDNTHFYSNTRMLEEAGIDEPPKTWFELVEQCEILKQKKISEYPLLVGFEAAEGLIAAYQFPIVWTFGGEFFDEDLNPIMNSAEAVEGITWLTDLWRKHDIVYPGALTETEHDIAPIFARGEAAFMWTWTYYVTTCLDPSVSTIMNEFDTFITPGTEKLRSANASTEWMVPCPSPFSKHIEEAFLFAEYFASPENTKRMLIEARIVSAWKSVYEDPEVQAKVPHFDTMMESMKWAKPRSLVPWYPEFSDMITKEQHNAWAGKITPQEMMDKIAKQCSEWKKEYE